MAYRAAVRSKVFVMGSALERPRTIHTTYSTKAEGCEGSISPHCLSVLCATFINWYLSIPSRDTLPE